MATLATSSSTSSSTSAAARIGQPVERPGVIHLDTPAAGSADPRKLNLFAGRALSEREFELLQAYVDDRIRPLAGLLQPGISSGLGVQVDGGGALLRLRIQPGSGVGAGGRLVRLAHALELSWADLAAQARDDADVDALRDGFYYLTLHPVVEQIEPPDDRAAATRSEVDPLLARRHEVVALPGLQRLAQASPRWLSMAPLRAANRVCVQALQHSPFDPVSGALPLALLAVQAGQPLWVDTIAGRCLAEPDAAYRSFLAHSVAAWQAWTLRGGAPMAPPAAPSPPAVQTGGPQRVDPPATAVAVPVPPRVADAGAIGAVKPATVPASVSATRPVASIDFGAIAAADAGRLVQPPLRAVLLDTLAQRPVAGLQADATVLIGDAAPPVPRLADLLGLDYLPAAGPFGAALLHDVASAQPGLSFLPGDLQVELMPVPASTVQDVIEAELPRGTVSLVHARGDRIRLLLAIPDLDHRHDLLDLPSRDLALEDELYNRHDTALASWAAWRSQWQALFGRLDLTGPTADGAGENADALRKAGAPVLLATPVHPDSFRNQLADIRALALQPGEALPEPYASHRAEPHLRETTGVAVDTGSVGLLARQAASRQQIAALEADLATGYGLINEITDFLGLQRQHLDNLTVSFTALAGGVAGDGSGMNLTRWSTTAALLPTAVVAAPAPAGVPG